jgi:hypothetical protein
MIVNMIGKLLGSALGLVGSWGKAKQEAVNARISSMERSWTDEVIVVTVFSPLWVGWFSEPRAQAWLSMVDSMPEWYTGMLFAVIGAVFGIGKMNGRKK